MGVRPDGRAEVERFVGSVRDDCLDHIVSLSNLAGEVHDVPLELLAQCSRFRVQRRRRTAPETEQDSFAAEVLVPDADPLTQHAESMKRRALERGGPNELGR